MLELRAAEVAVAAGAATGVGGGGPGEGGARMRVMQLVPRGYLGLRMLETSDVRLTPAGRVVRYCSYPVVLSVTPESPADRAGIEEGDTLIAYNERDLVRSGEIELDRLLVPGDTVRVSLRRERRPLTLPVVVGRQQVTGYFRMLTPDNGNVIVLGPSAAAVATGEVRAGPRRAVGGAGGAATTRAARAPVARPAGEAEVVLPAEPADAPVPVAPPAFTYFGPMGAMPLAGAQLLTMDDDLRAALGVRAGGGVLVVRVLPGSPAAEFGLRSGDVIRTADGRAVSSPLQFQRALVAARAAAAPGEERAVQVEVERRGQRKTITLRF
jgi:membrane-associated protease RseP (regulator of RpoE activity)